MLSYNTLQQFLLSILFPTYTYTVQAQHSFVAFFDDENEGFDPEELEEGFSFGESDDDDDDEKEFSDDDDSY